MAEITIEFTGQKEDIDEFTEALFEKDSVGTGTQKEIPGGGTITMGGALLRKSVGAPRVIEIVLSIGRDLSIGVAGAYIYDKLKAHKGEKPRMTIEYREIHLDKGEIPALLSERVESHSCNTTWKVGFVQ